MRFAIETTTTRGPLTGIGHYVHRLTEALLPLLAPAETLVGFDGLWCQTIDAQSLAAMERRNSAMSDDAGRDLSRVKYNAFLSARSVPPVRLALRLLKQAAFHLGESKFDTFHAVQMIPPGPFRKPVLPVIHDLSHIRFPQAHPSERVRWLNRRLKLVLNEAPFIQTVSRFSKQEIISLLGIPAERIQVAYPGIAAALLAAPSGRLETSACLDQYGVTAQGYFLMVSTREPRKNFKTTTEAYAGLPAATRERFPLLWIGHRGWGDLDLSPAVGRAIASGEIRQTGYLPDSAVRILYQNTRLFMMSSIYEGFGMPVTEALACGAPTVVSDIPVFREVAGVFARFVDALDVDGWRGAMLDAVEVAPPLQSAEVARWLMQFTWQRNASQTIDLYRRLAGRRY